MRLLILDGIGGIPLGLEIHEAFQQIDVEAKYCNLAKLAPIPFYNVRSAIAKLKNRAGDSDRFFHLPKSNQAALENILRTERPSHILVIGFLYKFINPSWLRNITRELKCELFLYDTDSCNLYSKRREFLFFLDEELPIYDRVFSFSKVVTYFLKNTRGLAAQFCPFGAKPLNLPAPSKNQHDVLFVGSGDLRRVFVLEQIAEHVAIYGNRWERNYPLISSSLRTRITDKSVWGDELLQLLADSKIILNITRTPFYGAETGINLRIFEALAAGRMLLTDYCDEVAELFVPGVEIETFKGSKELAEKVSYYLAHPEAREVIAQAGYRRFLAEFTWQSRVRWLASQMGLA